MCESPLAGYRTLPAADKKFCECRIQGAADGSFFEENTFGRLGMRKVHSHSSQNSRTIAMPTRADDTLLQ